MVEEITPDEPEGELTCELRMLRVVSNLDTISLKLKTGDSDDMKKVTSQVVEDFKICLPDSEETSFVKTAMKGVEKLAARYYMSGEVKEIQKDLNIIKELAG